MRPLRHLPLVLALSVLHVAADAQSIREGFYATDGDVYIEELAGNVLYIGGAFTRVGPPTGGAASIDATTGLPTTGLPKVAGNVFSVASDGSGGWYIGGFFTAVGGVPRNNLAHILSDKSLAAWNPGASSTVTTLALVGNTLYAGGAFTTIAGVSQSYLAAFDTTTGALTSWNPGSNGFINQLVVSGGTVYVGGSFSTIGGATRFRIAALSTATGLATGWNPNMNNVVYSLAVVGGTVYAGGQFSTIGGSTTRNRLVAIDAASGLATAWNPNVGSIVRSIAVSGSTVFAGGDFVTVNGATTRNHLAAFDATTGTATAWNPNANGIVRALAVSGSTVYVAGEFTAVSGATTRNHLAAFDTSAGNATSWNPDANGSGLALAVSGSTVFTGGAFTMLGGAIRNHIAAVDATTGAVTSWDPNASSDVYALAASGGTVYAGGAFATVNGATARARFAAIDAATGIATSWNPGADNSVGVLTVSGGRLYAGGLFTTVNSTTRNRLASFDLATGALTSWDPNANNTVNALAVSGGQVYAGGDFTAVNGATTRTRLAAFDAATGVATVWNASADNSVYALAQTGGSVYAGGLFLNVNGATPRNRLAAFDAVSGAVTGWDPNASNAVYSLAAGPGTIYAGGDFTTINGGTGRVRLAALDAVSGTATSWNPGASSGVYWLTVSGGTVYAGGGFTVVGGVVQPKLAAIVDPLTSSTITATAGAGGSISPSGSVTVLSGASQSFTIAPTACHHVAGVLVDGASVGTVTTYTFTDVAKNHTIDASFATDADGTACSDGNPCTSGDTCSGGACSPGPPTNCDDGNVCTDDSCSPALGCIHDPNDAPCDDGSACTTDDVCKGGVCSGVPTSYVKSDPDGITLTAAKGPGPGAVTLNWTGGAVPYRVTRSSSPQRVLDAASDLGRTYATTWGDTPPAGIIFYYQVTTQSSMEPPVPPPAEPCNCDPHREDERTGAKDVNLFAGEFHHEAVDLRIAGRGLDFVWARRYRSRFAFTTALGNGWDFSYNLRVIASGANMMVEDGNTRADVYSLQPDGTWTRSEFFRILSKLGDLSFRLTFPDTSQWNFKALDASPAAGKIASIVDRNGNSLTFLYDGTGKLTTVTDTLGRNITIGYDPSGRIATVTDFAGRQVRYVYYQSGDAGGAAGDLKSARSPLVTGTPTGNDYPLGKTTVYTYTKGFVDDRLNHNLLTITDPRGVMWVTNLYASTTDPTDPNFDHVTRQIWGDPGDNVDIVYVAQTPAEANGYAIDKAIVNDRVGNVREFSFDFKNRLVRKREYTGRANPDTPTTDSTNRPTGKLRPDDPDWFDTIYEHNRDSLLTRVVDPNGNSRRWVYEADLNPCAAVRSRGNLREVHRDPGAIGSDQSEIVEIFEYDLNAGGCCGPNMVTRHVDGRGNQTLYTYDAHGNLLHTQHRIPTIVEDFEYNIYGQQTAHTLPDNGSGHRRRDELSYYSSGSQNGYLLQRLVDAGGFNLATVYEYNSVGKLVRMTDPRGHDTQYVVNSLDQVVQKFSREVTTGSGIRYRTDTYYDPANKVSRVDVWNFDETGALQSNNFFTTIFSYDALDRVTSRNSEVDDSSSVITDYVYDANRNRTLTRYGQATSGADPFNVRRVLYDERDLPYRETRGEGSATPSTTQGDYDGNRNLKAVRRGLEAGASVTTFAYDGFDRRVLRTDPMGNVTTYHYDANGNKVGDLVMGELLDVNGGSGNVRLAQSSYQYDAMDRLTRTDDAFFDTETQSPIGDGQSSVQTVYTPNSQRASVTDDNSHTTTYAYDGADRLRVETDARGNTATYSYDANSNRTGLLEVDLPDAGGPTQSFQTTYTYDNLDRPTQQTDNAGDTLTHEYDSRGNSAVVIDGRGNTTRYIYDGLDRLVSTQQALTNTGDGSGSVTHTIQLQQSWDASSRLASRTDDNGNTTSYSYDSLNRRTARTYADGTSVTFSYNPFDKLTAKADANGNAFSYTYDAKERMSTRSIVPGPGVSPDTTLEQYQYDGTDHLVRTQDDDSLLVLERNSLGYVTQETEQVLPGGVQKTTVITFDGNGNRTRLVYPGGRNIVYTYDSLDRRYVVRDDPPGPGSTIGTYSYIGRQRVQRLDYGNGLRLDDSYDTDRRIAETRHSRISDAAVLDDRTYSWDPSHNKITQNSSTPFSFAVESKYFSFDSVNQLIHSQSSSGPTIDYTLDGVGNRTFTTGPDYGSYYMDSTTPEPADRQMNQYSYTPWGSRLYDANGNLIQAYPYTFGFNALDELVSFTDSNTGQTTTYRYDSAGRRIEKNVAGSITRFRHSGFDELEEEDAFGATLASHVWGEGIDALLQTKRGGVAQFHHADDLGSTVMVTDASGSVLERNAYGDYGTPQFLDPSGSPLASSQIGNAYLFMGRRFDPESGLGYFRHRYQDTRGGRPLSRDEAAACAERERRGNAAGDFGNNPVNKPLPMGKEYHCLVSALHYYTQRCRNVDCLVPCQVWTIRIIEKSIFGHVYSDNSYETCECHDLKQRFWDQGKDDPWDYDEDNLDSDADWEPYKKACLDADAEELKRATSDLDPPTCEPVPN